MTAYSNTIIIPDTICIFVMNLTQLLKGTRKKYYLTYIFLYCSNMEIEKLPEAEQGYRWHERESVFTIGRGLEYSDGQMHKKICLCITSMTHQAD